MRGNRRMTQQKSNNEFEVKWKKKALRKIAEGIRIWQHSKVEFTKNAWSLSISKWQTGKCHCSKFSKRNYIFPLHSQKVVTYFGQISPNSTSLLIRGVRTGRTSLNDSWFLDNVFFWFGGKFKLENDNLVKN